MHNLRLPYQDQIDSLELAGYAPNEVEAYRTGYTLARGRHPEKYDAGWRALDKQRARNNEAEAQDE